MRKSKNKCKLTKPVSYNKAYGKEVNNYANATYRIHIDNKVLYLDVRDSEGLESPVTAT